MSKTILSIEVPTQRIDDLLFGHCTESWLHEIQGNFTSLHAKGVRIVYDKEDDNEGDGNGSMIVYPHHVLAGLSVMARSNPYQFSEWLKENDDITTCDVAWQHIIFGKEIYG